MIELIWEQDGVVRQFSGAVNAHELESSALQIQADPRFAHLRYVLHDFSDCSSITVDDSTRDRMVARAAVAIMSHTQFVSAFIGTLPELVGMVRYFKSVQVYDGPFDLFESLADARAFVARGGLA